MVECVNVIVYKNNTILSRAVDGPITLIYLTERNITIVMVMYIQEMFYLFSFWYKKNSGDLIKT